MTTDNFIPATPELQALVDAARTSALALGRHVLGQLGATTAAVVSELHGAGWRVGVEVSIDQRAEAHITLTAIPSSGLERRVIAEIARAPDAPARTAH